MKAGYRLHRLELRNWGTFHGDKHYVAEFAGDSTCFTGLNQSGKSTAMDGVLTLLVPHEFRHYNVAATMNEAKRERSIRTYIMGPIPKANRRRVRRVARFFSARSLARSRFSWVSSRTRRSVAA